MEGTDGQTPLVCPGHTRGVVQVSYSNPTPDGVFLISACLDAKVPALADCGVCVLPGQSPAGRVKCMRGRGILAPMHRGEVGMM